MSTKVTVTYYRVCWFSPEGYQSSDGFCSEEEAIEYGGGIDAYLNDTYPQDSYKVYIEPCTVELDKQDIL